MCAFSLSPELIVNKLEDRTASLAKRLQAIKKCADHGWPIGLRFDPIIYFHHYEQAYQKLIEQVFEVVSVDAIHSISVGPLRFPKDYFKIIKNLYPEEPIFSQYFELNNQILTYPSDIESALTHAVIKPLQDYGIDYEKIFRCYT